MTPTRSYAELRDPVEARRYALASALVSRCGPLTGERVINGLRWARELLSEGAAMPPLGLIVNVGDAILSGMRGRSDPLVLTECVLDAGLTRRYEDYVLGKLFVDSTMERASDAIDGYPKADQDRAVAFVVGQACRRCAAPGVLLNPTALAKLLEEPADSLLPHCMSAWNELASLGLTTRLESELEQVVTAFQSAGAWLGPEDVFELESGTAVRDFGQKVALRQTIQAADFLQRELPPHRPTNRSRSAAAATHLLQEDAYPVGGFTSLTNRGTLESLLRSELAYMDPSERPDLFDMKYVRDELLYYARDENQFTRHRLTFFFHFDANLIGARHKDAELDYQRMILALGTVRAAVDCLLRWLREEALSVQIVLPLEENEAALLREEQELLEVLFRQELSSGLANLSRLTMPELLETLKIEHQRAHCQGVLISQGAPETIPHLGAWSVLSVAGPRPALEHLAERSARASSPTDNPRTGSHVIQDANQSWRAMLGELLQSWI